MTEKGLGRGKKKDSDSGKDWKSDDPIKIQEKRNILNLPPFQGRGQGRNEQETALEKLFGFKVPPKDSNVVGDLTKWGRLSQMTEIH